MLKYNNSISGNSEEDEINRSIYDSDDKIDPMRIQVAMGQDLAT